jgi:hypothetical protein
MDELKIIVEIVQALATVLALVVGGVWAFFRFVAKREHVWNLDMTTNTAIEQYSSGMCLLVVRVTLKNVGAVPITPGPEGLLLSVRAVPTNLDCFHSIEWKECEPRQLEDYNMIGKYDPLKSGYLLEVGCTYQESHGVIVEAGRLYHIKVKFCEADDAIVDYSFCHCP